MGNSYDSKINLLSWGGANPPSLWCFQTVVLEKTLESPLCSGDGANPPTLWFFWIWCWRRLLRVPWRARRSNQSLLKEINPEFSLEGLMLKLKLQYFGHLMRRGEKTGKNPWCWKDWWRKEKRAAEDKMAGWHHQVNGREFEQAPGDGEGQGSLVCCHPWGCKESDRT